MKNLVSTFKKNSNRVFTQAFVASSIALVSSGAFANENLFQPLLDGIDVAPIKTGILSAGAMVIGITVVVMAVRKVKGMFSS